MKIFELGTNFIFQYVLSDGKEDKFIELNLYDTSDNSLIGSYDVPFLQDGIYQKKDLATTVNGIFIARATVYKDAAFTNRDKKYQLIADTIRVESISETINENIDDSDGRVS